MTRLFYTLVFLATLPLAGRGGETVVRLIVPPINAPKPALKYLLLPEVRELKPGNPAQYYLRCFMEQRNFFFTKYSSDLRARYLSMPLAKLAAENARNYGGSALRQVDWAARLNAIDWEMVPRVQNEGADLSLPELGPLRILAEALQVRFRIEVAGHRFDDAVRSAKTMFALARHLGEFPAESANFLGLTVAGLAVDTLNEMVQQPDCPNLYWALTDLPRPLVELRKGLQGDCTLKETEFRPLREDAVLTEEQLEKVVSRLSGVMAFGREQAGQAPRSFRASLAARVKDAERVRDARARLFAERRAVLVAHVPEKKMSRAFLDCVLDVYTAKDCIDKFSPLQVILLDEKHKYEIMRDERMKLLALAPWQIDALGGAEQEHGETSLFGDFLPRVIPARRKQAGFEQRLALLRHVEAFRLYAAGHDGQLPEKLSEIPFPLPVDPFTGKPFVYRKEGAVAQLRGGSPQGVDKNPVYNVRHEVRIRK
ncbi:MAG TPA: hypothetical protein VMF69_08540 [Gemmataceae bacterium]|nr:hypothetical protein [Gemmataceae bacterium]